MRLMAHKNLDVPSLEFRSMLYAKSKALGLARISLKFASQVTWTLGAIVDDIVKWLNAPTLFQTSKVGTLSLPQFLDLVRSAMKDDNYMYFQCMIYAQSLAYTQSTSPHWHFLSVAELHQIGAFAGHTWLKKLDEKLKPQYLSTCSKEQLHALFLLLIGTILAVGYTRPVQVPSPIFNEVRHIFLTFLTSRENEINQAAPQETQFGATQEFLCKILAHYVVFISSKLKLAIPAHVEHFILEAAHTRWRKEGFFSWFMDPMEQQEKYDDPGSPASNHEGDQYDDTESNSSIESEEPDFDIGLLQNALDNVMDLCLAKSSSGCFHSFPAQELQVPLGSSESRAVMTQNMSPYNSNHESSSAHERPTSVEFPKVSSVFRNRFTGANSRQPYGKASKLSEVASNIKRDLIAFHQYTSNPTYISPNDKWKKQLSSLDRRNTPNGIVPL